MNQLINSSSLIGADVRSDIMLVCSRQSSWSLAGRTAFHTASITCCTTLALTRSIPLLKCPVMFLPEGRRRQTVARSHKCQSGAMLTSRWDKPVRAIVMSRFKRD